MPEVAKNRLRRIASGGTPGSMMNDDEYLLLDGAGFEPRGPVSGLSVVHLGEISLTGTQEPTELEGYSRSLTSGLASSFEKMLEEADALGADGVYLWGWNSRHFDGEEYEYRCRGTALRFRPEPGVLRTPKGRPFLTACSAMTLYQFLRRGLCPVSFRHVSCVYHVPHRIIRTGLDQGFDSSEVPLLSTGWYSAQETALARLEEGLEEDGSELNLRVGVEVDQEGEFGDYTAEFKAYGRGWRRMPGLADLISEVDITGVNLIRRSTDPWNRSRRASETEFGNERAQ